LARSTKSNGFSANAKVKVMGKSKHHEESACSVRHIIRATDVEATASQIVCWISEKLEEIATIRFVTLI
jgi:hypothetical protein